MFPTASRTRENAPDGLRGVSPQSAGHWRLVWPLPYYLLSAVQYRNSPCATQTHEGRACAGTAPVVHAFANAFVNSHLTAAVRAAPQSMHKLRGAWMVLTALTFGVCWRMERRARSVFECFIRCTAVCRSCTRRRLRSDGQQRRCKVRRAECTQPSGMLVCLPQRVVCVRTRAGVSRQARRQRKQISQTGRLADAPRHGTLCSANVRSSCATNASVAFATSVRNASAASVSAVHFTPNTRAPTRRRLQIGERPDSLDAQCAGGGCAHA